LPPLYVHLVIAREVASRCKCEQLQRHLGSYFLGSTIPDVHVITTSLSRQETHFFDLNQESEKGGIKLFLETHPELSQSSRLSQVAGEMVAGYLSHLVTDELWIANIYRPFFGPASPLGRDPQANLLDRALQHELEQRERADPTARDEILSLLRDPLPVDGLGFIDGDTLKRWQGFVYTLAMRQFSWENFRHWVERALMPREKLGAERVKRFLDALPQMRELALQQVTWQRLDAFKQKAVASSLSAAEEYFS
jgi:hypothetical protein